MDTKFKVDDIVKVVTPPNEASVLLRRDGDIVVILGITKTGKYKIDGSRAEYTDDELEKVG